MRATGRLVRRDRSIRHSDLLITPTTRSAKTIAATLNPAVLNPQAKGGRGNLEAGTLTALERSMYGLPAIFRWFYEFGLAGSQISGAVCRNHDAGPGSRVRAGDRVAH
jgi:hypothetical protein